MFDLYREQILERSKQPRFRGNIEHPTHTADGINASCGDEVHWELRIQEGSIVELAHQCRACAICSASADLLAEELHQKTLEQLATITAEHITELLGIPLSPTRLKCALLPLETIRSAVRTD
jgi:nitrogen fixation NifU-like protein